MKIAIVGASGQVGSRVAAEALSRGHSVTGIARDPSKIAARPGLTAKKGDIADPAGLAKVLAGHDAVVSSARFSGVKPADVAAAVRKWASPKPTGPRPPRAETFSSSCAAWATSTGPSCPPPRSSRRARARGSSASAATRSSSARTGRAASRWRTTRSPSSTSSRRRGMRARFTVGY